MSSASYNQLMKKLFSVNLFGGMKLGLANCLRLDAALGSNSKAFRSIHVAGTNGKGSVTKKISVALEKAGYKVGTYTSPHISCFRERIQINGQMISEESIVALLPGIFAAVEREKIPATFFEITTLLAFAYFAKKKVDIAVLETGLGGRLDATNIITPELSVITSIALDHTDILGSSIEEIAAEKAGIIKPGIPVVLGPRMPQKQFLEAAHSLNSPCIVVSGNHSSFEEENNAIAKAALESLKIGSEAIERGLKASLPCRFEIIQKNNRCILLDVAHNPDGLQHLFAEIKRRWPYRSIRVVFGLSKTKDLSSCLRVLMKECGHFYPVEAPNGRGVSKTELYTLLQDAGIKDSGVSMLDTITTSIHQATIDAAARDELIVVCGTFFIMSEARQALGIDEPRDSFDLNEQLLKQPQSH